MHCRQAEARGECWLRELKGRQRGGIAGAARADLGPGKQATGLRVDQLEPDRDGAVPCAQQRERLGQLRREVVSRVACVERLRPHDASD